MTYHKRPVQIDSILKTLDSGDEADFGTELETYIAELEAKQPVRPSRIVTILVNIGSQYPVEMKAHLDAYITDLEAKQQVQLEEENEVQAYDPENPPVWSYERFMRRQKRRQERAARTWKMLNNYL